LLALLGAHHILHVSRIRVKDRKQRTDNGKYSCVNRAIKNWSQLPAEALGNFRCKPKSFRKRVRKAICKRGEAKGIEVWRNRLKVKRSEVK